MERLREKQNVLVEGETGKKCREELPHVTRRNVGSYFADSERTDTGREMHGL